jgi:periplasmic protein TonB
VPFPIESQVYLPREIAAASDVPEQAVIAALDGYRGYVGHHDAVAVGRALRRTVREADSRIPPIAPAPFAMITGTPELQSGRVPFAVSGSVHAGLISAVILVTSFTTTPARMVTSSPPEHEPRLVFLNEPGPGGGGGGGGARQPLPATQARRAGRQHVNSPVPERELPPPVEAPADVPPLASTPVPTVVAPVVTSAADIDERAGTLERSSQDTVSPGPGADSGAGAGRGAGAGSGDGNGIGRGSGGGTGGGPYRPGAGITPPRLLKEVKPQYTEDARRAGVTGEVMLEVVVRRDGTVGDVKLLRGLGGGLDARAIEAVRRWQFAPAAKDGDAVDVLVEIAVEFSLR